IRLADQVVCQLKPVLVLQIDHDAALVAIGDEEVVIDHALGPAPRLDVQRPVRIAIRRLDLDHVRAPVGHYPARHRTRRPCGHFNHLDSAQRTGCGLVAHWMLLYRRTPQASASSREVVRYESPLSVFLSTISPYSGG